MKRQLFCLLFIILSVIIIIIPAYAENQETNSEISSYIETEFEKTHIPGMSVQIVDTNEVLFAGTYGNCSSLDSSFVIGSLSKSFTAVGIMQLVEQDNISLSDPISKYLAEVSDDCETTVKQLLNQTSGIKTNDTLEDYSLSDKPVNYEYANTNYSLLGQIIESVSGMDYSSYIQKYIFEPLGMEHSYCSLEQAQANGLIEGYRNYFGLMIQQDIEYPIDIYSGWLTIPSAYIISSTNDMGRYLQMYLNGGDNILTKSSVETMMFDSVEVAENYEYGLGLGIDYSSDELMVIHGGNVENYTTYMIIVPEQGIAAIVMCNAGDLFSANDMLIQPANNIVNKYLGKETDDLSSTAYIYTHVLIDGILLVVLFLSILPLFLIKKWANKNSDKVRKSSVVISIIVHVILPTFILLFFLMIGYPMFQVQSFAPDVFILILICITILYLTGVIKFISCVHKYIAFKKNRVNI